MVHPSLDTIWQSSGTRESMNYVPTYPIVTFTVGGGGSEKIQRSPGSLSWPFSSSLPGFTLHACSSGNLQDTEGACP